LFRVQSLTLNNLVAVHNMVSAGVEPGVTPAGTDQKWIEPIKKGST
jgi:hypothetical protein